MKIIAATITWIIVICGTIFALPIIVLFFIPIWAINKTFGEQPTGPYHRSRGWSDDD